MFLSFRLVVVLWGIIFAGALPAPRNLVVDGAVPVPTPSESPASIPTPDSLSARASSEQSGLGAFCRSGVLTALSITAQNDLLTRTAPVTALSNSVINACINDVLNILVTELAIQRTSSTTLEFTPVSAPAAPAVDLSTSNSAADAQLLELPTAVAPATVNGCPAPPTRVLAFQPVQCTKRPRPLVPGAAPGQLDDDVDLDEPLDNESDEADLGSPISDAEDIHGISKRGPPFRPVAAGGVRPITVPAAAAPFRGVGAGAGPVAVVPAAGTAQRIGAGTVPARPITVPVAVVPAAGTAQRIGAGTVPAIAQPRPGFGAGTGTGRAGAGVVNFRSNPYLTCMTRTYLQCD